MSDRVELKHLEMENQKYQLSIFIGDCKFHTRFSF